MPEIFKAKNYQKVAIKAILKTNKLGLFLDMGLGKTVSTLTALQVLKKQMFDIGKCLIIAPKNVVNSVWLQEVEKWQHLELKGVKIVGTAKQRIAALYKEADFYLISVDNFAWLADYYKTAFPFDTVVIDESSKFKSSDSQRFRALKRVIPKINRAILLTGTPAPNGLLDLWAQLYIIDSGERLEPLVTRYREKYFNHNAYSHSYTLKDGADKVIHEKIKDVCISMSAKDYLDLPPLTKNVIKLEMDETLYKKYKDFEKEQVLKIKDEEITAINAAALANKLLQFSNGAVYDEERKVHNIHDLKIEALGDIVEEANGNNILVAYNFQHDLRKILDKFKFARALRTDADVKEWNEGKVRMLVLHPASGGHGLNLQFGGHISTWFGLPWSLELFEQFNARILRPGQKHKVISHMLLTAKTIDERVLSVLNGKSITQGELMKAVKAIIDEY